VDVLHYPSTILYFVNLKGNKKSLGLAPFEEGKEEEKKERKS